MYLASLCNSTAIEMYADIIRVSHGFRDCQMLRFIAREALRAGADDITSSESRSFRCIRWRYIRFKNG